MSNNQQSHPEPIAIDPAYRLRDNQFWYNDCAFADVIHDQTTITLWIAGLGPRVLTHAAPGRDGRPTHSFTLTDRQDRVWWEEHRGEQVRVELLRLGSGTLAHPLISQQAIAHHSQPKDESKINAESNKDQSDFNPESDVLCIGLDIAWFGGSAGDTDSQYDCLATVSFPSECANLSLSLDRVRLADRDPEATQLLDAIDTILQTNSADRVVFSLDAPIQAEVREHFDVRTPLPTAGMVERRACDNWLSARRQKIDREVGGTNGWHPNIQPGAPLAPRIERLLEGLVARGFDLWRPDQRAPSRLVIECFPAEAIWAIKRMGLYPDTMTAAQAKSYKSQKRNLLNREQVQELVHDALDSFGAASVGNSRWNELVKNAINWMLNDQTWQTPENLYRGGKLLDDVVDTMICLSTSLSYVNHQAHVWFDSDHPGDGHIIGPGFRDDGRWIHAWPPERMEVTP